MIDVMLEGEHQLQEDVQEDGTPSLVYDSESEGEEDAEVPRMNARDDEQTESMQNFILHALIR